MAPKITDEDRKYEMELRQQIADGYDKLIAGLEKLLKLLNGE